MINKVEIAAVNTAKLPVLSDKEKIEIIEYLAENNYINDKVYVEKYIQNVMRLKNSSVFEMKMDLLRRGIDEDYIENYISKNYEELEEFENQSAIKKKKKKSSSAEIDKVKTGIENVIAKLQDGILPASKGGLIGAMSGISEYDSLACIKELYDAASDVDLFYSKECQEW